LAFSFGESSDVNSRLASKIDTISKKRSTQHIYLQWEIWELLSNSLKSVPYIYKIDIDPHQDYLSTKGVVEKFKERRANSEKNNIYIICQAWHAAQCIATCEEENLNVVGGRFVEVFSPNDPQTWVRNAFAWILKDSNNRIKL
jgi:hypothetical protein